MRTSERARSSSAPSSPEPARRLLSFLAVLLAVLLAVWPAPSPAVGAAPAAAEALLARGVRKVIFAERSLGADRHWYANFGYFFDGPRNVAFGDRGRLLELDVESGRVRTLLDDPRGAVRDPQVHYDAGKILFSYRPGGTAQYHLYEIRADGTGLRQLTDGIYDDIEPSYLPDGGIVFVSSRSRRWVQCWQVQVATLHRCDADGGNIRPLSANVEMDNTPWVLPDGRIIYMRWEYVDRSQVRFHHLWTCHPDGTNQTVYFGNMHPGGVFIDPKPIPDTEDIVYIESEDHGLREHEGFVSVVGPRRGPDDRTAVRRISPELYRDPYPVASDCFIVATDDGLEVLDAEGRASRLHTSRGPAHEPRPLVPRRRERVIPSRVDLSRPTGTLVLDDVYAGRNMEGIERGEIKRLLVLETLPKPINFGAGMHDFIPISHGGTFTLERILGTVPVEPDGSAHFELPAQRPLFFIALDERNASVKRMHSFLTVMPGETLGCVGCHEGRVRAPPTATPGVRMAMRRAPSRITPIEGMPFTIDFPRDIQPILDAHCVRCHDADRPEGRVLLHGDHGVVYSTSYFTLTATGPVSDGRNRHGNTAPRAVGDSASPLMRLLDGTHHDARPSPAEVELVRNWIHVGAPYPGTYAALGTGMVRPDNLPPGAAAARRGAEMAHERRCGGCHGELPRLEQYSMRGLNRDGLRSPHLAYDLTRPAKSPILLAPLAREAGGWGWCREASRGKPTGGEPGIDADPLRDTGDPDYRALLRYVEIGRLCLERNPRWDSPGFRPHPFYVREMQRYGVLPETLDAGPGEVDVFRADRRYWMSSWHLPDGGGPRLFENETLWRSLVSPVAPAFVPGGEVIEGESLEVVRCDGGVHMVQELRSPLHTWSGDRHLLWMRGMPGQSIAVRLHVEEAGRYALVLRLTRARDFGRFQLHLDGERLGRPVDLYSRRLEPSGLVELPPRALAEGAHTLRVEAVGTSSELPPSHPVGVHLFGLDCIVLRPVP